MDETSSIGEMLDMDPESGIVWNHDFDFEEDDYDDHTRHDRSIMFDIIWDELGTYPPEIDDDPVIDAILDDDDHEYAITIDGETRTVGYTGIAMYAHFDEDVDVEVAA